MIELSPAMATLIMVAGLILGVSTGYHLAIVILVVGLAVGFLVYGPPLYTLLYLQLFGLIYNYVLLAIPLFVFMGAMLERSGLAEKMFAALYLWLSGLRGGLAVITVLLGTIIAACVGVISASVSMLSLFALPAMMKRGYDRSLAAGAVCGGGSLGILIPPSIMLIIYGPLAQISVGRLFMAAFFPGFLLSGLYCSYIIIRCFLQRKLAPAVPPEERAVPLLKKTTMVITSVIPPAFIILAVLGSIFLGVAPPTEAAAVGGLAAILLTAANRRLNYQVMKEVLRMTLIITSMAMLIGAASVAYTGVFLNLGCGKVVQDLVLAVPGGRWGAFAMVMFIYFILGFLMEWIGIFFIMVPIMAPLAPILGFDPLWFGMMICINLQMSFMTPPYAFAIFILRGTARPEFGITTADIIRGVAPYVVLIIIGMGLCIAFPQLITWLPGQMIKGG